MGDRGIFPYKPVSESLTGISRLRHYITGENPVELKYQQLTESLPAQMKKLVIEIGESVAAIYKI